METAASKDKGLAHVPNSQDSLQGGGGGIITTKRLCQTSNAATPCKNSPSEFAIIDGNALS